MATLPLQRKDSSKVLILGVGVAGAGRERLLRFLTVRLAAGQPATVLTPNPEFLVLAARHPWFRHALNRADVLVPDGVGVQIAAEYLAQVRPSENNCRRLIVGLKAGWHGFRGQPFTVLPERIPGADLFEELCRLAAENDWRVYLLGGRPGVAAKALAAMREKYPGLKGEAESGPEVRVEPETGRWLTPAAVLEKMITGINEKKPDLLFVGWDMEKQVKLLDEAAPALKAAVLVGVGGTFDYYSRVSRAPESWRRGGWEWLYRLYREPRRWRRIWNAVVVFPWLVFRSVRKREPGVGTAFFK